MPTDTLLDVQGLKTYFFTRDGVVRAVDGLSFSVARGETLAIVGESGCGKSVTSLSILRLIASPPGRTVEGSVVFEGRDLLELSEPEMRKVRGDAISMIFQEPMTSLNPVLTIGRQIAEVLTLHRGLAREDAMRRALEMLKLVSIANITADPSIIAPASLGVASDRHAPTRPTRGTTTPTIAMKREAPASVTAAVMNQPSESAESPPITPKINAAICMRFPHRRQGVRLMIVRVRCGRRKSWKNRSCARRKKHNRAD